MNLLSEQSRIAIIAIVAWTLAVGISYLWNIKVLDDQIIELANAEAESNLKRDLSLRLWSTDHGGIYLRVNKDTQPSPFLAHVPQRDIITPDGGMLTLQNPAATLREIKEKHEELYGELARITAIQYLNPNNAPDEWEVKALGIVEKSREDYSELTTINGMPYLRRMQPMWMEEGCMSCHAWTGIEIGELRGATDIAIPLNKYQAVTLQQKRVVSGIHFSILLIGLIVIGFITNRRKTRLEERKQAEAIIKRSETKFRTLFDTSANAILMLNEKGFFDCNQAALEMFGLQSQDELRHYRPVDLSPATQACGTDSETLAKHYIDTALQDGTVHFEWIHKRADSETIFITDIVLTSLTLDGKLILQTTIRDITDRKKIEHELQVSAIAFESQEGMMVTDADSVIIRVNKAFTSITGYNAEEVIGNKPNILSSGRHEAIFYKEMWEAISATDYWEGEVWNKRKDGGIYPEKLTITAVKDSTAIVTNYVGTITDITLGKQAEQKIEELAYYDPLTHLPNRRLMIDRIKHTMAANARSGNRGALLFLDLDHFKDINDTLGHDMGDLLLQQVAERLTSSLREGDTVSRFGGDEFVVLLEGLSSHSIEAATQAEDIANKVLSSINLPYQLASHNYTSSVSIGITLFGDYKSDIDELLKQADIAMYQAKEDGRNTLRFFDPQMQANISARVALEKELNQAVEQQQFQLYYQIQIDDSLQPLGAEALIRWNHPERGLVSPIDFIPVAEQSGSILAIGQWVLDTACAQLKVWQQDTFTRELTLSVNVSPKQFRQADFVSEIIMTIQQHAINPARLKLELTESLLLDDVEDTVAKMITLAEIGIQFSLDDFGTGYSSLQYLKRLPLYQLKIDKSFVDDLETNSNDQVIVRTIIAMADSLGLSVIAEGVETKEQQQCLLTEGCTHYQGYLFSKPVSIDVFEALLRKED